MWLYAEIKTLGDIPRHYARTEPGRLALRDDTGRISFAQLNSRSNQIANALAGLGVVAADRVAFLAKNTARYFEVLFAANKLGAALLPLNWRLAAPEIEEILADAKPRVLIADREYLDLAKDLATSSGGNLRVIGFDSARTGTDELDTLTRAAPTEDPAVDVNPLAHGHPDVHLGHDRPAQGCAVVPPGLPLSAALRASRAVLRLYLR